MSGEYFTKKLIILGLLFSSHLFAQSAPVELSTTCIGPLDATHSMIYLHGMDSVNPSAKELHNRDILFRIALKLKIKIALPRATMACPNLLC